MPFYLGNTITTQDTVYDYDGITPLVPDTITVTVYDPNGVQKGQYTLSSGVYNAPVTLNNKYVPSNYFCVHPTSLTDMAGSWKIVWNIGVAYNGSNDSEEAYAVVEAP